MHFHTKRLQNVHDKKRSIADDDDVNENFPIAVCANNNTMKSEIKCVYRINFSKPNVIGSLLGFSLDRILQPRKWHKSDLFIISVNIIRVQCNMSAYSNNKRVRYEFSPNVALGYRKHRRNVIYLPIIAFRI